MTGRRTRSGVAIAALGLLTLAGPALAQTCRASAPETGRAISGPVMHVIDGRTLCVAQGPTPDQWIPVRISSAPAALPSDRERLMAAAFSQSLVCTITGGGSVRTATCSLAGRPLDAVLAEPATITKASAWR